MSMKSLKDNLAFYEADEEDLKAKLAKAPEESTQLVEQFDSTLVKVADIREKLDAKEGVGGSGAQGSCKTLRQSLTGLVGKFLAALNKLVSKDFCDGSIYA